MRDHPYLRAFAFLCVAGLVWVISLRFLGWPAALATALVVGGAAAWFLPPMILSRIAWTVPGLVLLLFVSICLMWAAPGDPFASEKNAPEAVLEQQKANYGILESPVEFFWEYMKGLTRGYLGPSIKWQGRSVTDLLLPALPVSISLGLLALVLACAIGLFLGIRAGLKPNSVSDYSSMGLAIVGISVPNFVIGAVFMIIFALGTGLLPVAGWGNYSHLILPAFTLALPTAAYVARLARSGTIEVMSQDFVRTARAKGLPERAVVLKHALKGAILPVVSFLGPGAAYLMTGSFVVEILFGVPGMGQYFVKGAINRDYYLVLGTVLIYVSFVIVFNLLVDLAYAWLDPRVRGET
jgi:oligopeptide transport system permease protein